HVGDEDRVLGNDVGQLFEKACWMNRPAGVVLAFVQRGVPGLPFLSDPADSFGCLGKWAQRLEVTNQLTKRGLCVTDQADFDRIDLSDLLRLDVDLDQPRWRNRKREARIPGTAVRLT